jgi:O-antigen/teichoic acid export membrane protein
LHAGQRPPEIIVSVDEQPSRPLGSLIRHTLVYGSGYVTMAAVSLVLVPVYTHHFSPSEFGLLALMLVLYGLMKQVYDLGFMNSVARFFFDTREHAHGEGSLHQMRSTSLGFLAAYGGLLTVGLWALAEPCSDLLTGSRDHADLVRIVAITLYAEALSIVPLTLIRVQERSGVYVLITTARFVVTLVLSVLFVAQLDWGVRGALLGNAIPAAGVLLLLLPDYRLATKATPSLGLLREMLAFGLPFFPVLAAAWLIEASDRYLLELLTGREEVGWYSLAGRVAQAMQIGVAAFAMAWTPIRYRVYEGADAPGIYRRLTSQYVIVAGVVTVALAAFAQEIVAIISPPSFEPAASVVPVLVLAYALYGLYLMMVTGMGVSKRTRPMAWIAGAAAAVNVGLNLLLIPRWGMHAAAATTVLANAIMVAGTWYYSQRAYAIPYDWVRIAKVGILSSFAIAASLLVTPSAPVAAVGSALLILLAFIATLVVTGTVSGGELAAARGWIRQARLRVGRPEERAAAR